MNLDKRTCKLGVYLNTPTQKHGDERVPAKVLGIKNVMLTKAELNEMFNDIHAWDMLFVETKGKPALPYWSNKSDNVLRHHVTKFVESEIDLVFGLKLHEICFGECTIKSLKFEPQEGGLTAMSFTIVGLKSKITGSLAQLDEHLNGPADITIEFGAEGDDEEENDEDQAGLDLDHSRSASSGSGEKKTSRGKRPSDGATVN